jgi:hypothetical protein
MGVLKAIMELNIYIGSNTDSISSKSPLFVKKPVLQKHKLET